MGLRSQIRRIRGIHTIGPGIQKRSLGPGDSRDSFDGNVASQDACAAASGKDPFCISTRKCFKIGLPIRAKVGLLAVNSKKREGGLAPLRGMASSHRRRKGAARMEHPQSCPLWRRARWRLGTDPVDGGRSFSALLRHGRCGGYGATWRGRGRGACRRKECT